MESDSARVAPATPSPQDLQELHLLANGHRVAQAIYVVAWLGIADLLAADEYVDYWTAENTWQYLERDHDRPDQPWFVWCGFCGPHPPYDPPEPYASLYDLDAVPLPPLRRARQRNVLHPGGPGRFERADGERVARRMVAYYWAMMTFIDDMVGRIMETLSRRGLWEHTLVIFTTDHGAMLGDFGKTGKSDTFLEPVIHVPYLVVPPGGGAAGAARPAPAPRTYDGFVEHVDLAPTILDYAGIEHPQELPGYSLRPVLEDRPAELPAREYVSCEYGDSHPAGTITTGTITKRLALYIAEEMARFFGGQPLARPVTAESLRTMA
jgi:arylsulfatase A-like enzyme